LLSSSQNLSAKGGEFKMLFAPKEKGQGMVEYALIIVLIAVVLIVVLALVGLKR
jgi:pilus assembly protein Flp/PilA